MIFFSEKSKLIYLSVESLLVLPPGVSLDLDLDPGVVGVLCGEDVIIWALDWTSLRNHFQCGNHPFKVRISSHLNILFCAVCVGVM